MGSYTSRELQANPALFREVRATNIGCYLDRIDKVYKPYADAFLRDECKGFNGEYLRELFIRKGDDGIRDFLKDKINVSDHDYLNDLLLLCKKFLECKCMHPYLEFWQRPGMEVIFDPVCMDCKRSDGSIGPNTKGSLEVKGDGNTKRLQRQREIQEKEIFHDASESSGESELRVAEKCIRLVEEGVLKEGDFHAGDAIECNFRGKGIWYPGKIARNNGDKTYDIAYDNFTSDEEIGRRSRERSVTIQFLLDFTNENKCWEMTTKEVRRRFIIPFTEQGFRRYADLERMRAGPSKEGSTEKVTFISHCWEGSKHSWGDLVSAVCDGCEGEDRLLRRVWIDVFAVRQWPNNQPDVRFNLTVRSCDSLLAVCSSNQELKANITVHDKQTKNTEMLKDAKKRVSLLRVWTQAEIDAAVATQVDLSKANESSSSPSPPSSSSSASPPPLDIAATTADKDKRYYPIVLKAGSVGARNGDSCLFDVDADMLYKMRGLIDIRDAATTVPADKSMIIEDIIRNHGNIDELNHRIQAIVAGAYGFAAIAHNKRIFKVAPKKRGDKEGGMAGTRTDVDDNYSSSTICAAFGDRLAKKKIMKSPQVYLPYICSGGFTELLCDVIRGGVKLDLRSPCNDVTRETLLMLACRSGSRGCAEILLENGCYVDVEKVDIFGNTALAYACINNQLSCMKLLMEDPRRRADKIRSKRECRLGSFACSNKNEEILEYLLEQGCEIDIKECFLQAAHGNSFDCIKVLIKHSAIKSPEIMDHCRKVTRNSKLSTHVLDILVDKHCIYDKGARAYKCISPLCSAKNCINLAVESLNLNAPIPENLLAPILDERRRLMFCSAECYIVSTWGMDVDVAWRDPATGRTALMNACLCGRADSAEVLLYKKSDINAVNCSKDERGEGLTPLLYACLGNSVSCVNGLLNRNVDRNLADKHGTTPLMVACRNRNKYVVMLLLEGGGCDVTAKYINDDTTIVMRACSDGYSEIVRLLIEHKAITSENEMKKCCELASKYSFFTCKYVLKGCIFNKDLKAYTLPPN